MPMFTLKIAHLPSFRILRLNPMLTSKLAHENFTTNIEKNALKSNPFIGVGSQGLKRCINTQTSHHNPYHKIDQRKHGVRYFCSFGNIAYKPSNFTLHCNPRVSMF
jgi:hypothetical protein